jgi:pyrimidine-nucleoside phosphorylase
MTLGTEILLASGAAQDEEQARARLQATIDDGSALERFRRFIAAQGGDPAAVDDESLLPQAPVTVEATSRRSGYVCRMDAQGVGVVSMHLGGGRATKEDVIDLSVGVVLHKKVGDHVSEGESLGTIHARTQEEALEAVMLLRGCYTLSDEPCVRAPLIKGVVR